MTFWSLTFYTFMWTRIKLSLWICNYTKVSNIIFDVALFGRAKKKPSSISPLAVSIMLCDWKPNTRTNSVFILHFHSIHDVPYANMVVGSWHRHWSYATSCQPEDCDYSTLESYDMLSWAGYSKKIISGAFRHVTGADVWCRLTCSVAEDKAPFPDLLFWILVCIYAIWQWRWSPK